MEHLYERTSNFLKRESQNIRRSGRSCEAIRRGIRKCHGPILSLYHLNTVRRHWQRSRRHRVHDIDWPNVLCKVVILGSSKIDIRRGGNREINVFVHRSRSLGDSGKGNGMLQLGKEVGLVNGAGHGIRSRLGVEVKVGRRDLDVLRRHGIPDAVVRLFLEMHVLGRVQRTGGRSGEGILVSP